jgi:hypothetical protein
MEIDLPALPQMLLGLLDKLSCADSELYGGGLVANLITEQFHMLLRTGMHAAVLQLIQQQHMAQVLGRTVKHALEQLFQHLGELPFPDGIELSTELMIALLAELSASCDQWGGANKATCALLIARQLAESGALAHVGMILRLQPLTCIVYLFTLLCAHGVTCVWAQSAVATAPATTGYSTSNNSMVACKPSGAIAGWHCEHMHKEDRPYHQLRKQCTHFPAQCLQLACQGSRHGCMP